MVGIGRRFGGVVVVLVLGVSRGGRVVAIVDELLVYQLAEPPIVAGIGIHRNIGGFGAALERVVEIVLLGFDDVVERHAILIGMVHSHTAGVKELPLLIDAVVIGGLFCLSAYASGPADRCALRPVSLL